MHEETLIESGRPRYVGGACTEVADGSIAGTGGGSTGVSYAIMYEGSNGGVKAAVTSGTTTVERFFDRSWLRGEKPAEDIEVALDADRRLRVHFFGGKECVRPREPNPE